MGHGLSRDPQWHRVPRYWCRLQRLLEEREWQRRQIVRFHSRSFEWTKVLARIHVWTWSPCSPARLGLLLECQATAGVPSLSAASRAVRRPRLGTSMPPPAFSTSSISRRRVLVYETGPS